MEPKRKRMKADERRQEIIRAAMEVFARNGFGGSTTREIAENAGISGKEDNLFFHSHLSISHFLLLLTPAKSE